MAKLPVLKIADKVANPLYLNLGATIVVAFLRQSPMAVNPWLTWLQDSTVMMATLTIGAAIVGYKSEEKAYDDRF